MSDLPVNIDSTYDDDGSDASVQLHQAHHDALHALYNDVSGATPDLSNLGIQGELAEGAFVDGDKTKLDGIEASADVTDATNVDAAGAVMNSDTSTASMSFVVDEDDMSSDSATKVPTQQSVKAYVDASGTSTVSTVGATGSTEALAFASGLDQQVHDVTMDENCTFSFSGAPSSGTVGSMTVIVRGAFTPTWPASVDWAGGSAPTYGAPSVYEFLTVDGGTTVLGFLAGATIS